MNNQKVMNILLCVDDFKWDYTRHCAVTILSLLETNKNHKIKIFVMSSLLPEENIIELKRIVKSYNQEIEFIIRDNLVPEEIKASVINRRNLTWGTWYRLFFPLYIKNIDRLLYLDCDILVTKDIEDIYNMDMKWKAIAWYYDIDVTRFISEYYFGIKQYINAWVLLIDVEKFSEYKINKTLIMDINKKYWNNINNSDQDYINLIFKDDIYIYKKLMNYQITTKFFNVWLNNAKIIHCLSKPYVQYNNVPNNLVEFYYSLLNLTKWKWYPEKKAGYWCFVHMIWFLRNFIFHWFMFLLWDWTKRKIFCYVYKFLWISYKADDK